ncbi:MAG: hypothetical protein OXI41_10540 [Chloroflexota bacterium]|nr:hypothetical protein [Chloroflexota bacterium]MDE2893960.1 hypothetical protein [Chloroflexota bacterium]
MTEPTDDVVEPDSVTDWADWGRRQGGRWGKEFSGRAQTWRSEAWSWSHPRQRPDTPLWSRFLWGVIGLPVYLLGSVLFLALVVVGAAAALAGGTLLVWFACGLGSAAFAARRGWPGQLGGLLGFALGPIGLLIVRRLPERM